MMFRRLREFFFRQRGPPSLSVSALIIGVRPLLLMSALFYRCPPSLSVSALFYRCPPSFIDVRPLLSMPGLIYRCPPSFYRCPPSLKVSYIEDSVLLYRCPPSLIDVRPLFSVTGLIHRCPPSFISDMRANHAFANHANPCNHKLLYTFNDLQESPEEVDFRFLKVLPDYFVLNSRSFVTLFLVVYVTSIHNHTDLKKN